MYHPTPVFLFPSSFSSELEHIAARTHSLTSLALSQTNGLSSRGLQQPTTTISSNFTDLVGIRLVPGGQIMVAIHRRHLCIWFIPFSLLACDEGEREATLVGSTPKFEEELLGISYSEISEEGRSTLQLTVLERNVITVFQLPLSTDLNFVSEITVKTSISLNYGVTNVVPTSNGQFSLYFVDKVLTPGEDESSSFLVLDIFDCINFQSIRVRLWGISESQRFDSDFHVVDVAQRTLVVRFVSPGPTRTAQIWLYPLPLVELDSSTYSKDAVTAIRPSGQFKTEILDGQWVNLVHVFGDRFVGVLIHDLKASEDEERRSLFHILEICDDFSVGIDESHGPLLQEKLLVSRGLLPVPPDFAPPKPPVSDSGGGIQALFADIPGERQLRMYWSGYGPVSFLCTIGLDTILDDRWDELEEVVKVHKLSLRRQASSLVALDPFSGRCVHVQWNTQARVARVFEGLGIVS
ncbi:hypothetical protein DL96DRAFT_1720659 [Flagelloscypha sp. PMI_526]|nr:hypothetical protein DL96DRAFT_1720659 [Flagelloscypha sp. PMI_526]